MRFTIIYIMILIPFMSFSQKVEEITHRTINIHHEDSTITFNILLGGRDIKPKNNTSYFWYHRDAIYSNQGGYKEKLLDGKFQVVSQEGQLITEGFYKDGTKYGTWKKWNKTGELLFIYNWKDGSRYGKHQLYDKGHLIKEANYNNGKLHGKVISFENDTISDIRRYKKGELQEEKSKSEKEKKGAGNSSTKATKTKKQKAKKKE